MGPAQATHELHEQPIPKIRRRDAADASSACRRSRYGAARAPRLRARAQRFLCIVRLRRRLGADVVVGLPRLCFLPLCSREERVVGQSRCSPRRSGGLGDRVRRLCRLRFARAVPQRDALRVGIARGRTRVGRSGCPAAKRRGRRVDPVGPLSWAPGGLNDVALLRRPVRSCRLLSLISAL